MRRDDGDRGGDGLARLGVPKCLLPKWRRKKSETSGVACVLLGLWGLIRQQKAAHVNRGSAYTNRELRLSKSLRQLATFRIPQHVANEQQKVKVLGVCLRKVQVGRHNGRRNFVIDRNQRL